MDGAGRHREGGRGGGMSILGSGVLHNRRGTTAAEQGTGGSGSRCAAAFRDQ